jgi:hypothetical protein
VPSFVRPFVGRTLHKFGGVLGAQVNVSDASKQVFEDVHTESTFSGNYLNALGDVQVRCCFGCEEDGVNFRIVFYFMV